MSKKTCYSCGHDSRLIFGRTYYYCKAPACQHHMHFICDSCLERSHARKNFLGTFTYCPKCINGELKKV